MTTSANFAASADVLSPPPRLLTPRRILAALGAAALFAISWHAAEVRPSALFSAETFSAIWRFLSGLFPPDLSPEFLRVVVRAIGQTIATAIAGSFLSVVTGLPLGLLATSTLWRRGVLLAGQKRTAGSVLMAGASWLARVFLGFVRAVPDLVWALLFVTAVGLGSLAGTLALAVAYAGILGRVYADVFDSVDPQPLEALQSTGATRVQIFLRGIWPQALPGLTAYTLYSFECCVRAAAVLGFVGAGGVGYEIALSMRLFDYRQVLTLIFAFIALLAMADVLSRALRARLHGHAAQAPETPALRQSQEHSVARGPLARLRRVLFWLLLAAGLGASFVYAGFTPDALVQAGVFRHMANFSGEMFPPDLTRAFVSGLGALLLQTVAIALLGTLLGVVLGSLLAVPATSTLVLRQPESPGHRSRAGQWLRWLTYWAARLALNLLRAIPELVWVLICILAVGIGPFAGTIAIGVHTAGVLGKLYAETMEEVPRRPLEALYALGARPLQVMLRAIWPQAKPMLGNYTLLRWEANLRASTILGLVGGGGLGQSLYNNLQLGFYPRVATLVILVYGLVILSDWASHSVSHRLRGYASL